MAQKLSLLEEVAGREGGSAFGYGIGTAAQYLKSLSSCMGDEACILRSIGESVSDSVWKALTKEAESKLTYCTEDMAVIESKAATSIDEFKKILKRCKDGIPDVPKHCAMVFEHYVTSSKMDRDRDILESEGADVDPRCPFLWQHIPLQPVGKLLGLVSQDKFAVKAVSCILDINSLCADVIKFIEADVLRISQGFKPKDFEPIPDDRGSKIPNGFRVKKFEIVEVSGVSVPANSDAVITLFSRKSLQNDLTKAWAKSLYDQRPVMTNVPLDLSLTINGQSVKLVPETKGDKPCSCGGSTVAKASKTKPAPVDDEELEDDMEEGETEAKPRKPPKKKEDVCAKCGGSMKDGHCSKCDGKSLGFMLKLLSTDGKAELHGEESELATKLYASVADSFEWVRECLQKQIRDYLKLKQIVVDDEKSYSYCYLEATMASSCIVAVETRGKQSYYQVDWKKNSSGYPSLDGDPVEVTVQASITTKSFDSLGRRLAFSTSKASRVLSEKNVARLNNAMDYAEKAKSAMAEIKADHESKMAKPDDENDGTTMAGGGGYTDPVATSPANSVVGDSVNLGKSVAVTCLNAELDDLENLKNAKAMLDLAVATLEEQKAAKANEEAKAELDRFLSEITGN